MGRNCYQLLRDFFNFPLPSLTTLDRYAEKLQIMPGISVFLNNYNLILYLSQSTI
jgi:hypothetical protein